LTAPERGDIGIVHESAKVDHVLELDSVCHQAVTRGMRRIRSAPLLGMLHHECRLEKEAA
jgi:hypothetical protein